MKKIVSLKYQLKRWTKPLLDISRIKTFLPKYYNYFQDRKAYSKMKGAESIRIRDSYPILYDKTVKTSFEKHYFYQDIWAYKKILKNPHDHHIDVGSRVVFVGFLTAIKKVTFIDIRPLIASLENFESRKGSVLSMPYSNNSILSLSCLHVAEHVGLGRYGDPLDPLGTKKAAKELSRVLAPKGLLYFSVPIGKPKLHFNAHRIHSTKQIMNYFSDLKLLELSGVDDQGNFIENIDRKLIDSQIYGCGFFCFTKE